ncbi:YecH family protein [Candidatus Bipolaricaulota bacterium]|nr:YecH family protein [Candidatus Bipolaricaulota bacterium]
MTDSIHGHEVMRKMIDSGRVYTEETLQSAITKWFGESARFHTCSAEGMTSAQLIAFLASRRKFYSEGTGFKVDEGEICNDA